LYRFLPVRVDAAGTRRYPRPVNNVEERTGGVLEIHKPRTLTGLALFVFTAYGLLLFLPAVLSMLVVSAIPFGLVTFALPILSLGFAVFLLPFGFGNTHAARLANRFKPGMQDGARAFLVQVTFSPKLRTGLRCLLEDADDIGWVYCRHTELHFLGDSVQFKVPFKQITALRRENAGWRGLFLYSSTCVEFSGVPGVRKLWFAERSSCLLPASRIVSQKLHATLAACAGGDAATSAPGSAAPPESR
jgi:hypothetical protein